MKRVLEVFGEPISKGGQETYVLSSLSNINLSNFVVDSFTPYYCDNDKYVKFIKNNNGKVIVGNKPFKIGGTRREIIPVFEDYLKNNKYDIVHIHSGSISMLAYYAKVASKHGVNRVIVHSHSAGNKENIKHFLIKRYAASFFKKYATDFCACSIEAAEWKYPKSVLPKVNILNNGVDSNKLKFNEELRKDIRNSFAICDDELVLGHIGRFTKEKNQIYLVDLMCRYLKINPKVKLMLVGDGEDRCLVENKVKELSLEGQIVFTGIRDASQFLNAFDIFLFPSIYEGLGIAAVQAQANGLPVIASDTIPKAMQVSNNVTYLSLNNMDQWIQQIEIYKDIKRIDNSSAIKSNGYDIKDSAQELYKLYVK